MERSRQCESCSIHTVSFGLAGPFSVRRNRVFRSRRGVLSFVSFKVQNYALSSVLCPPGVK